MAIPHLNQYHYFIISTSRTQRAYLCSKFHLAIKFRNLLGPMNKKYVTPIIVGFFILAGAAFSFYYYYNYKSLQYKPRLGVYGEEVGSSIRPFKLINQLGDTITEQDVKGKILVVEYFFSRCKSICPVMNENMALVYEAFKTSDDVLILSHTCDPEYDDVSVLQAYSQKFNADPKRWLFLTGSKKDLYNQALYSYKIAYQENIGKPLDEQFIHAPNFVLVDKQGRLRASKKADKLETYNGTDTADVRRLINDIQELINEG